MIFATALLLSVKVSNIWDGVEGMSSGYIDVASAVAQSSESILTPTEDPIDLASSGMSADGLSLGEDTAEIAAERLLKHDPTLLTQAEIELLQRLAIRREELEVREKELEQRSSLLAAAEERINSKIIQLRNFQITIDDLIVRYDEQKENKMQSLVKIYESMKPKDAALIFQDLDMETLLMVAERMKERKLSDIMAKLQPAIARDITVELVNLRDLPEADTKSGG